MSGKKYSSADPFIIAWIRRSGISVTGVFPDPKKPGRMRVELDLPDEEGVRLEIEYRNSDYRKFVQEYQDSVDLIKRR